jgi:cytochrome c oxidase subunit 2
MLNPPEGRRGPSPSLIIAGVLIAAVAVVVLLASFTVFQLPTPVTTQAEDIEHLYWGTLAIAMAVYFLVTAGIIFAIFRYRRRSSELPEQIHGSTILEFSWTAVPVLILVGLYIPSFLLVKDLKTPPAPKDVDVQMEVIGHQWFWEFVYCKKNADGTGNCEDNTNLHIQKNPPNFNDFKPPMIVVPVGQTVRMQVRSTDVIHSFYVPHFLYKIQAVPGNVNELHFRVTKAGTYSGQCYQFCGLRHADMRFVVQAMAPADYQNWVNQQRQAQGLPLESNLNAQTSGAQ